MLWCTCESRGYLKGVCSLLPCGFWELNIGHHACQQMLLTIDPSCQSNIICYSNIKEIDVCTRTARIMITHIETRKLKISLKEIFILVCNGEFSFYFTVS